MRYIFLSRDLCYQILYHTCCNFFLIGVNYLNWRILTLSDFTPISARPVSLTCYCDYVFHPIRLHFTISREDSGPRKTGEVSSMVSIR